MTTLNEARDAAYKRMIAEWPATFGSGPAAFAVPYCFDDESLDTPEDVAGKPKPWVRLSVRNLAGGQESLGPPGNRKYRRRAAVRMEAFTAPGTGLKKPDLIVQKAIDIFEGVRLAGALTYDGRTAEVGLVNDGRWKLSTAEVNFDYEEIK